MCNRAIGFKNINGLPIMSNVLDKLCNVSGDKDTTISEQVTNLFLSLEKQEKESIIKNDLQLISKSK
jgi:hypothetical protein